MNANPLFNLNVFNKDRVLVKCKKLRIFESKGKVEAI